MTTKLVDGQKYEVKEISGYGSCLVPVKERTLWEQFEEEYNKVNSFGSLDRLLKKYVVHYNDTRYNDKVMFTVDDNGKPQIYLTWTSMPCYMEHRPNLGIGYLKRNCVITPVNDYTTKR